MTLSINTYAIGSCNEAALLEASPELQPAAQEAAMKACQTDDSRPATESAAQTMQPIPEASKPAVPAKQNPLLSTARLPKVWVAEELDSVLAHCCDQSAMEDLFYDFVNVLAIFACEAAELVALCLQAQLHE